MYLTLYTFSDHSKERSKSRLISGFSECLRTYLAAAYLPTNWHAGCEKVFRGKRRPELKRCLGPLSRVAAKCPLT